MNLNEILERYRVTKGEWRTNPKEKFGVFQIPGKTKNRTIFAICSDAVDGIPWEHVSLHVKSKNAKGKVTLITPSWEEMCKVKDLFWNAEDCVVQFHPPKSEYVNNHEHCLHLWKPTHFDIETPPSILTGIKDL